MGNWFSGDNTPQERPTPTVVNNRSTHHYRTESLRRHRETPEPVVQRERQFSWSQLNDTNAQGSLRSHSLNTEFERPVFRPVLVKYVFSHCDTFDWDPMSDDEIVKYVELLSESHEYRKIEQMFRKTTKKFLKVTRIERVQNPYLYAAYLLKKEEMQRRYGYTQEKLLFHGTKAENIHNICSDNFDWRRRGVGTGHRYGQGVSFTPISYYASHYSDKRVYNKVMLVVKVMISEVCDGTAEMILPPVGFDTTQKPSPNNGPDRHDVIVKYGDNEFYPIYKVFYCITNNVN